MMKVKDTITIYPNDAQIGQLLFFLEKTSEGYRQVHCMSCGVGQYAELNEAETIFVLEQLSDNDKVLRPMLQEAGQNVFGW